MSAAALVATGLTLTADHRRSVLLDGVDLRVGPGEAVGLVGASGSGKTTLLRLLLALGRPDAGRVTWAGDPVRPDRAGRLRWFRRAVQYVPQDPAACLDARRTVAALLREPLLRLRVPGPHPPLVRSALESVDLPVTLLDRRAGELSGGQAQRVAIARALAVRPVLLLADEPVSGLDLPLRDQVLTLLGRAHHEQGTGLLLVSHDLTAVARTCSRVVVLDAGRVVEDAPTGALLRHPRHPATRRLLAAVPRLPLPPSPAPPGVPPCPSSPASP